MIKICKQKAIDRWTKIGNGIWYCWNFSFIFSIIIPITSLLMGSFTKYDFLLIINAVFSGVFMLGRHSIFISIKEKQKLFAWNEDC